MPQIACENCGTIFEAKRPHARLCSARCRKAASRGSVTCVSVAVESVTTAPVELPESVTCVSVAIAEKTSPDLASTFRRPRPTWPTPFVQPAVCSDAELTAKFMNRMWLAWNYPDVVGAGFLMPVAANAAFDSGACGLLVPNAAFDSGACGLLVRLMPARIEPETPERIEPETFLPAIIIFSYGCRTSLVVCFAANAAARATRPLLTLPKAAQPDGGTIGAASRLVRAFASAVRVFWLLSPCAML
jgi:hypothetical protein